MKCDYISHMGNDLTVVNAARVSFDKESDWDYRESWEERPSIEGLTPQLSQRDVKLINYLAGHGHWTPFAHAMITMRETVPIFVARQRWKHEVGFGYQPEPMNIDGWMEGMTINEVSRRYVDDTPEFFFPDVWRSRPDGSVKQGSGEREITEVCFGPIGQPIHQAYEDLITYCTETYERMLEAGVAPEQARMVLPQSMYTSYYVTGSLAAWARAYKQRIDSHAQKEIQDLARNWDNIIRPLFPTSWSALLYN